MLNEGGTGDTFYVENVFEELDYATEFFYNETSNILYFVTNGSKSSQFNDINDITFEVTQTKVLVQLRVFSIVFIFFFCILLHFKLLISLVFVQG